MTDFKRDELGAPKVVDRSTFHAELDPLRVREKAHTKGGDAIAAAAPGSTIKMRCHAPVRALKRWRRAV